MEKKQLPPDFKDFFEILNRLQVRYMVAGGWALALHGWPRATRDIDIWVAIDSRNADKIRKALSEFGAPGRISDEFFSAGKNVFWMGREPTRIELISGIDGVEFDSCYERKKSVIWDGVELAFLSYDDFVRNKKASGRLKDLADLESLGEDPHS